jgi:hypothetical protein
LSMPCFWPQPVFTAPPAEIIPAAGCPMAMPIAKQSATGTTRTMSARSVCFSHWKIVLSERTCADLGWGMGIALLKMVHRARLSAGRFFRRDRNRRTATGVVALSSRVSLHRQYLRSVAVSTHSRSRTNSQEQIFFIDWLMKDGQGAFLHRLKWKMSGWGSGMLHLR